MGKWFLDDTGYDDGVKDGINEAFKFFETNMEELKNILNSHSQYEASRKLWHFAEQLGGTDIWK